MQNYFKFELAIYVVVWTCAVLYSIFCFAGDSRRYFENYDDEYSDFTRGWAFLSRRKDTADYEWQTVKLLIQKLSIWIIISIGLSEVLRKFERIKPVIFTVAFTLQSKLAIWLCNGISLFLISLYKYSTGYELMILFNLNANQLYITILAVFWINLKCVSYYLDSLSAFDSQQTFLSFLSYCLYLPTAFCGPFIQFKDFKECYQSKSNFANRLSLLFFQICRFTFWLFFIDFFLHFVYVNAAGFHPEWVATLSPWSLYGYGYTMGQFFHIKYIVIYGLSTSFARFENVVVPSLPVCIGRIHLYSDMWRYFDAGLYNFLLRYIYIPIVKSNIIQSRLLGSLFCFIFVYVWHGTDDYIMIWSVMNYIAVALENFGVWIHKEYLQKIMFVKKIGPLWLRRISCMFASPLLAFSAISNFYFFARTDIGNIFVQRFLKDKLFTKMILLTFLYCCCQVSTELRLTRRIAQQTMENKNKR